MLQKCFNLACLIKVPKMLPKGSRKEGFSDYSWKGLSHASPSIDQDLKQEISNRRGLNAFDRGSSK